MTFTGYETLTLIKSLFIVPSEGGIELDQQMLIKMKICCIKRCHPECFIVADRMESCTLLHSS